MAEPFDLAPLIDVAERRAHQYAGCLLHAFLVQGAGDWRLHFGRLEFTDAQPSYPENVDYGWCRAVAEFLPIERGIKALRSINETRAIVVGNSELPLDGPPDLRPSDWSFRIPGYWPSDGSALGLPWPCNIAFLAQNAGPSVAGRNGPLVARNAPLYPDFETMVRHRAGAHVGQYQMRLAVLIPNFEARIARVQDAGSALIVNAETRHAQLADLVLKLFARTDDVVHDEVDLGTTRLPFRFETSARSAAWSAVLMRKRDAGIVDYRHSFGVEAPTDVDLTDLDKERLTAVLSAGESAHQEFKLYPRDDNMKRDLAESAVAFANSEGGVIFVGVRDDSTVQGVERGDQDALVSSLRDRSNPPVKLSVYSVQVDTNFVFAIRVPASESKPHFLLPEQIVYVRAGSSDRRATREEVQEMFRRTGPGYMPFEGR